MKDVFVRVDGSPKIGLGHLVRCHALALMLKDEFTITFFCREIPLKNIQEISESKFQLRIIQEEYEFLEVIDREKIVVLDGYHFTTQYQKSVKEREAKLVCIDDLFDKDFYCDLIVNHAPNVKPENYRYQKNTAFALGTDYVLLRPLFLEQAKQIRNKKNIDSILICFGGSDLRNLTLEVLQMVTAFVEFKTINVVTGAAYLAYDTLCDLITGDDRITHYKEIDEKAMVHVMSSSAMAIVPASGVLLEALACGCTVISGRYIDNQQVLFDRFKRADAFISAGDFRPTEVNKAIVMALSSSPKKRLLFDGESPERLRRCFSKL